MLTNTVVIDMRYDDGVGFLDKYLATGKYEIETDEPDIIIMKLIK